MFRVKLGKVRLAPVSAQVSNKKGAGKIII